MENTQEHNFYGKTASSMVSNSILTICGWKSDASSASRVANRATNMANVPLPMRLLLTIDVRVIGHRVRSGVGAGGHRAS